jgi:hypothetical protein
MNDNNQDRSQAEGQEGIDRETEQRNRENETGQGQGQQQGGQGSSGQAGGQQGGQDSQSGSSAFGQQGQSAGGGDTSLSERTGQTGGQSSTGLGSGEGGGFVGKDQDRSSDYLTKGEQDQDFAAEGQGAQDTDAGTSDIETGQSQDRASGLDGGSDSNR